MVFQLTSYAYGREGNVYCGADISPNSKGCCSDASEQVAERKEVNKTGMADEPRIFATQLLDRLSDTDSNKVLDSAVVPIRYSAVKLPQSHADIGCGVPTLRGCSEAIVRRVLYKASKSRLRAEQPIR